MSGLWRLSAAEAVDKLRREEVSPLEMVDSAAARIEDIEPKVNALPMRRRIRSESCLLRNLAPQ